MGRYRSWRSKLNRAASIAAFRARAELRASTAASSASTAPSISGSINLGTSADPYAFHAATTSETVIDAAFQSPDPAASNTESAPSDIVVSSVGIDSVAASVGTARASASTSPPPDVENSPYPGAKNLSSVPPSM